MVESANEPNLGLVVTTYNSNDVCVRFCDWLCAVYTLFSEIVVVDDCSTDGSFDFIKSRIVNLPNVSMLTTPRNSGRPSIPRNTGLSLLTDSVRVVFLDVDDLLTLGYLKFLSSSDVIVSNDIYTGVKLRLDTGLFHIDYESDFEQMSQISDKVIRVKNHVVFSGASLPTKLAKSVQFRNEPLEDWLYWRELCASRTSECDFKILKLKDVPIGYDASPTLSPAKYKQAYRIKAHLSNREFIEYLLQVVAGKSCELGLRKRIGKKYPR